ncbi:FAD-dependent oxidoreductase [Modestobacter sp. VKM Ac-2986]|uniref:FAD-dependent oxidoreductase n=1 Tax=Modestobacter sp. VKM Ac-2986 TaxID=3004140 RepID=UPI0022AA73B9|nr:FAD-dependent oxidoreductase [Modestobacter sp. VKM Ac-2986]MCZ2827589.1 FAD-dependent oxidoreductase [Modestobacter sp. VKM Ac-2986]
MSRETGVWDLLVVGGGTAGIVASTTAASLGARVLLVERERTGGDCLHTGCVPSKALLASATAAADARGAARLGVDVSGVEVDFARVMLRVERALRRRRLLAGPRDDVPALRRLGHRRPRRPPPRLGDRGRPHRRLTESQRARSEPLGLH